MLYLKDGEEISSFLALMGANKSVIKFEEIRVMKETRNNINRLVNCETANLNNLFAANTVASKYCFTQTSSFMPPYPQIRKSLPTRLKIAAVL